MRRSDSEFLFRHAQKGEEMKNSRIINYARIVSVLAFACCLAAATVYGQGAAGSGGEETGKHLWLAPRFNAQDGRLELQPSLDPAMYTAQYGTVPGDPSEGGIVVLPEGKRFQALQDAFDFCAGTRGGQRNVVLVPPGIQYGPFTLPPAGVTVIGKHGKLATILDCPVGSGPTITFSPGGAGPDVTWLSGLWIIGRETAAVNFAAAQNADARLIIDHCQVEARNSFPAITISGDGAGQNAGLAFDMQYSNIVSDADGIIATTGDYTGYTFQFSSISAGGTGFDLQGSSAAGTEVIFFSSGINAGNGGVRISNLDHFSTVVTFVEANQAAISLTNVLDAKVERGEFVSRSGSVLVLSQADFRGNFAELSAGAGQYGVQALNSTIAKFAYTEFKTDTMATAIYVDASSSDTKFSCHWNYTLLP